jgi:hypothetical protein
MGRLGAGDDPAARAETLRAQLLSPGGLLSELMNDLRSLRHEATVRPACSGQTLRCMSARGEV